MRAHSQEVCLAVAVFCGLVGGCGGASDGARNTVQRHTRLISVRAFGGLPIGYESTTITSVSSFFGAAHPPEIVETIDPAPYHTGTCYLHYEKLGLTFGWWGSRQNCGYMKYAFVTAPGWRTDRGLHIHDSVWMLQRLYPKADTAPGGPNLPRYTPKRSKLWMLMPPIGNGAIPVLFAFARDGRVVALGVTFIFS